MCLKGTLIWPKTVNGSIISDVQEADVNFPLPLYLYFTVLDLIWHDNPETERNDWAGIYNIISDFGSATQILDFPLKLQTLPKTILPLLTLNWDVTVGVMTPFQETSVWTGLFRLRSLFPPETLICIGFNEKMWKQPNSNFTPCDSYCHQIWVSKEGFNSSGPSVCTAM